MVDSNITWSAFGGEDQTSEGSAVTPTVSDTTFMYSGKTGASDVHYAYGIIKSMDSDGFTIDRGKTGTPGNNVRLVWIARG